MKRAFITMVGLVSALSVWGQSATIGDRVWNDLNKNGVQDVGEPGLAGVTVTLRTASTNALVATQVTDGLGGYQFTGLTAGLYRVFVTKPTNFTFTTAAPGADPELDSTPHPALVLLPDGAATNLSLDFGMMEGIPYCSPVPLTCVPGAAGMLYVIPRTNGDVTLRYEQTPALNDNTYGTNAIGWPGGHTFANLTGSDGAIFRIFNSSGLRVLEFELDYISSATVSTSTPSGYRSLGPFGGDGDWAFGNTNHVKSWETSIAYDLNKLGLTTNGTTTVHGINLVLHSPPATTNYVVKDPIFSGWDFVNWYEVTVSAAAFSNGTTIGEVQLGPIHNSPPKCGSNAITPVLCDQACTLGDFVWMDLNLDGLQTAGEPGVSGVVVRLYNAVSNVVGVQTTGVSGLYLFTGLTSGTYHVGFTLPAGLTFTLQDQGAIDAIDSDANPLTGRTIPTALSTGEDDLTWDAGVVPPYASIGDYVWHDVNFNGIQDGGETGLAGVVVSLYDAASNVVGVATTAANGKYLFTNLTAGTYFVGFGTLPGYQLTLRDQGANDAVDSDADPVTGWTVPTVLSPGENDLTWDAGLRAPRIRLVATPFCTNDTPYVTYAITPFEFAPTNGATIEWITTNGVVAMRLTNQPLSETMLWPGTVIDTNGVVIDWPGWVFTNGQWVIEDDGLRPFMIFRASVNPVDTSIELYPPATPQCSANPQAFLGDYVWEDLDRDGIQDTNETGVAGAIVMLYDYTNGLAGVQTTGVNGAYGFSLREGTYTVQFLPPPGYLITLQNQGTNDLADSDAQDPSGFAPTVTLAAGEVNLSVDAGLYRTACIGDLVWEDMNGNGIQDPGEPGIVGVTVELRQCSTSNLVTSMQTGTNGLYQFCGLTPGDYYLVFLAPTGYVFTGQNQGTNDCADSDANASGRTECTTLTSGEIDDCWDTGLREPASIGDFVWHDANHNGIQDTGEVGVAGAVVTLYGAASNVLGVVTTGVNGAYLFTNLVPGTYFVGFTPPAGYLRTLPDQGGNDAADSDANPATGWTIPTVLVSGENDVTWDAGLYRTACIGDLVWEDMNGNGIQDPGEPGIVGVTVELRQCSTSNLVTSMQTGTNGLYQFCGLTPGDYYLVFLAPTGYVYTGSNQGTNDCADSDASASGRTECTTLTSGEIDDCWDTGLRRPASIGDFVWQDLNYDGVQNLGEPGVSGAVVTLYGAASNVLGVVTTGVNGAYLFTNLVPGTYSVGFTPPAGYLRTLADQGGNDATDSDANPVSGLTIPTVLVSGENDRTWDAGLYMLACIGDLVWEDMNGNGIQDPGEPGIVGVTVELRQCSTSNLVTSMQTGTNGLYQFCGLTPGDYYLVFHTPAGYVFTGQNQGGNDCADSDANASGRTECTTLTSGEIDDCWDTGLRQPASIGDFVWHDLNHNGVQNGGEPGVSGTVVTLYGSASNVVGVVTTGVSGAYAFTNLTPGTYHVGFTPPAGWLLTLQDQGGNDATDSDANPGTGQTIPVTLVSGQHDPTWDAGLYRKASLGDRVWYDYNMNGVQDGGETGVVGVAVTLYGAASNVVGAMATDGAGVYLFTNLEPGTYHVGFTLPAGPTNLPFVFTARDQGGDDAADSDANVATGRTVPTELSSGEEDRTWDAGIFQLSALGDLVWLDAGGAARNNLQDPAETHLGAVPVTLSRVLNPSTTVDIAVMLSTSNGFSMTANYLFTGLTAGTYVVTFLSPGGHAFVQPRQGTNVNTDSDADYLSGKTLPLVLLPGQLVTNLDAGIYRATTHLTVREAGLERRGGVAYLTWETAGESGVAGFEVQRRGADGGWVAVGGLWPALGSTARGGIYCLRDADAAAGLRHEYRIIEVTVQGGRLPQGPFTVTAPAQDTGPAMEEPYGCEERPDGLGLEARMRAAR